MANDRILVIHAGGGKAGSSAIQAALAASVKELSAIGISYAHSIEPKTPFDITSGNGAPLLNCLTSSAPLDEGARIIGSYLQEHSVGICSSEFLGSMAIDGWQKLLQIASHENITIHVVFFVRNALDYLISSYNQDVKRGGVFAPMTEYVKSATWHHIDALHTLDENFGDSELNVINFDDRRNDIIGAFCQSWPELIPSAKILSKFSKPIVNRSLNEREISVVRNVNERLGMGFGQSISDYLIYSNPEVLANPRVSSDVANAISMAYSEETSWINNRFFHDSTPLKITAPPNEEGIPEIMEYVPIEAFNWAVEELKSQNNSSCFAVRDSLFGIDWQNAALDGIPPDFDPIAYLILNPDILEAHAPPFLHYFSSGRSEGRVYRWPQPGGSPQAGAISAAIDELIHERAAAEVGRNAQDKLRDLYQLEALLHGFAKREREYIDDIRAITQAQRFDRGELRSELQYLKNSLDNIIAKNTEISHSFFENRFDLISQLHHEIEGQYKSIKSEIDILYGDFNTNIGSVLTSLEAAQSKSAFSTDRLNSLDDNVRGLAGLIAGTAESLSDLAHSNLDASRLGTEANKEVARQLEGLQGRGIEIEEALAAGFAKVLEISQKMDQELSTLRDSYGESIKQIESKDAELREYRSIISNYREQGIWRALIAALNRSKRF